MKFTHLHCHSHYSLLDGANRIPELVSQTKRLGMDSIALTDHGNLYGALEFVRESKKAGIKPILGYEAYVAATSRHKKDPSERGESHHLTILAATQQGWENLKQLSTLAFTEGFYYKPRIDESLLAEFGQGLIVLSGCVGGKFCDLILQGNLDGARATAELYAKLFPGRFYIELQDNGVDKQQKCLGPARDIANRLGLPIVITSDCHYLCSEDSAMHDMLLCINTGKTLRDTERLRIEGDFYLHSPDEIGAKWQGYSEGVQNTQHIAAQCNVDIETGTRHFPAYVTTEDTPINTLAQLTLAGFKKRYGDTYSVKNRPLWTALAHEGEVINSMGFTGYFLILADIARWCAAHRIACSARGSACGSILSYCLGISHVDPSQFGLLFERFLDPARNEAPDIDLDIDQARREEVLQYVRDKYGAENVAQIITFGTLGAKAAVRDVGRAMDIPLPTVDKVCKLIPAGPNTSLLQALNDVVELRRMMRDDEDIRELLDMAVQLEGYNRHPGVHAAGVVISDKPITNYVPLAKNGDVVTTQWGMEDLERIGLLKMDFLGLKTLTVIDRVLRMIHWSWDRLRAMPLDDSLTIQAFFLGNTHGVFQFDSEISQSLLRRVRPTNFEHLIAVNALNRPATLGNGMADKYVVRRHGTYMVSDEWTIPAMAKILEPTYGIMVYQEQVMQVLHVYGGIPLSEAYSVIKAISKKKREEIAKYRDRFVAGAREAHGVTEAEAAAMFDKIEAFAGYGFNKSHATAYTQIAYYTAYLKTHYPLEFMAALMTCDCDDTDKISAHVRECTRLFLPIVPPNVKESGADFVVQDGRIRWGLNAIKGVGRNVVAAIIDLQELVKLPGFNTELDDLHYFLMTIKPPIANISTLKALWKAGALNCYDTYDRVGHVLCNMKKDIERARKVYNSQQGVLFTMPRLWPRDNEVKPIPTAQRLVWEREVLGVYLTGHPFMEYVSYRRVYSPGPDKHIKGLQEARSGKLLGGVVTEKKLLHTKVPSKAGNSHMAILTVEDETGSMSAVVFPDVYAKYGCKLDVGTVLFFEGCVEVRENARDPQFRVTRVLLTNELFRARAAALNVTVPHIACINGIMTILGAHPGVVPTYIKCNLMVLRGPPITPSEDVLDKLRAFFQSVSTRSYNMGEDHQCHTNDSGSSSEQPLWLT